MVLERYRTPGGIHPQVLCVSARRQGHPAQTIALQRSRMNRLGTSAEQIALHLQSEVGRGFLCHSQLIVRRFLVET